MSPKVRNVLFIFLVFAVFTALYTTGIVSGVSVDTSPEGFTLYGPNKTTAFFAFSDVREMRYVEDPDYGAAVNGGTKSRCLYGTWENEDWGRYQAFVQTKIPACIVVFTDDQVIVFNYESKDVTRAVQEEFSDYCSKLQESP